VFLSKRANRVDYILGFLNIVIVILTLFLIILILIQRGKGGGLAGAFGGMGGSSAFGARTGDVFTKVTVGVAIAWILLSMLMVVLTNRKPRSDWADPASLAGSAAPGSKSKPKGTAADTDAAPKLPRPINTELPDDVKALTDLPGALDGPVTPAKKD
jgi:preprotein translocase subunit SecG